ncbi:MAG: A/G-specific adenine glycosylase [Pseudomonadota bacterium]
MSKGVESLRRGPGSAIAAKLIAWQRVHGRHNMPWQGSRDPYRVWLSEVMLQQTQVKTVLAYYARFLERFADVRSLAAAPLDDVLALWSGLGYYSRARHLHRCAQVVVAEHGGEFPRTAAALAELPGIGRSTAAAIAAFCFGERIAILDGNVKRVLTRVLGFEHDLSIAAHEQALWQQAQALVPADGIEAYTQGLMDLGATLCSTRRPQCAACPLQTLCVAHREAATERYPVKTRKLKRTQRSNAMLWLGDSDDRVWLVQRPPRGVWAGLWTLPLYDSLDELKAQAIDWPGHGEALGAIRHVLTHFDWYLEPWRQQLPRRLPLVRRDALDADLPPGRWFSLEQALQLGLPAPVRRLLAGSAP